MLSPSDHCLRPVRLFLHFFGFKPPSTTPSRLPRPYTAGNDTAQYGPGLTPAPPQIHIDRHAPTHVLPLPPASVSDSADKPLSSPPNDCRPSSPVWQQEPTPGYPQIEQAPRPEARLEQLSSTEQPSPSHLGRDMFYQPHDFVMYNPVFVDNSSETFMTDFLKETIPGAEFDSSDPNMPSRCHLGTRLTIIGECQDFVLKREGRPKVRWVVGAAGVGKSAVMQSVAWDESGVLSGVIVGATIFFSVNGRQDGTKAISTISYQLAVKIMPYRLFLQREVMRDPSLPRKSLSTQFKKLIVEPFIHEHILNSSSQLLIIIDGLDECAGPSTQLELLDLILSFCITYPDSPLVWIITSRPEPHITSYFSQPKIEPAHEMQQILVDSDEAREDVTCYLRDKLTEVQITSVTLRTLPQWPPEDDFSKIAEASSGLFAYASTVVRYIGDPTCGNPVGQLNDVLEVIDTGTSTSLSGEDHPMARLDALYAHIMSKIPAKIKANTRKLLLVAVEEPWMHFPFQDTCNILRITQDAAYGATHHIRAVAIIPEPGEALVHGLTFFHKSYRDYLRDFDRSGFSPDIDSEAAQLMGRCVQRIIEEAPDGFKADGVLRDGDWRFSMAGTLKNGLGTGDNISVTWQTVREDDNRKLRYNMYRNAIFALMVLFHKREEEVFQSPLYLHVLTTCFDRLPDTFPLDAVTDCAFVKLRCHEHLKQGILKEISLCTLPNNRNWRHKFTRRRFGSSSPSGPCWDYRFVRLRFKSQSLSDPWNTSCEHGRTGSWEGPMQDWSTDTREGNFMGSFLLCSYCIQRLEQHLTILLPDHVVTICELTPIDFIAELRLVDPEDGVSEWIYHFAMRRGQVESMEEEKSDEEEELREEESKTGVN